VLNKKIIIIVVLVLIFFAGIIALTQENDEVLPDIDSEEDESLLGLDFNPDMDEWIRPARWFRSNSGGMALEELNSRFSALRNEYALAINYVLNEEIPEYLSSYYDKSYFVEVRNLYKRGVPVRTQWIFRDKKLNTRVNAVFLEPEPEPEETAKIITEEETAKINAKKEMAKTITEEEMAKINAKKEEMAKTISKEEIEKIKQENEEMAKTITKEETKIAQMAEDLAESEEEQENNDEKIFIIKDIKNRRGFIEIYDENYFLTSEYKFFEDGRTEKIVYEVKDNLLITAEYFSALKNGNYKPSYTDYYRYNRSLSLRHIERVFNQDEIFDAPVTIAFPRRIMDSVKNDVFINERINLYPDFFGEIFVSAGSKMDFNIDDKGRILGQTLSDGEGKLIWKIDNTWKNNRIVLTTKTEGETVLTAEFTYNRDGERINEKNYKDGVLERVVYMEGNAEIEDLYMNNVVVLRAVWEDGRKISETRIRN
jgi:hypothetical protein